MKKLITLTLALILLPLLATAQRGDSKTVEEFFEKYSEIQGYSSIEVTEDMFQMFDEMEDADNELIEFFKKLKYVRYMEYESSGWIAATGVSSGKGSFNYYVDGKAVNTTGLASGTGKKKSKTSVNSKVADVAPTTNIVVEGTYKVHNASMLYGRAMAEIDFKNYKQLMKSNQNGEKMIFLRRQWTSEPVDQEFLLISGNTFIHIRGDLNIKHLYELEEIIAAVGEILPI